MHIGKKAALLSAVAGALVLGGALSISRSPIGGRRAARRRRSPNLPRRSTRPAITGSTAPSPAPAARRGRSWSAASPAATRWAPPSSTTAARPKSWSQAGPDARPDRTCHQGEVDRGRSAQSLLDSCTIDGKIYCVPVNIHSWQWLWLSNKAFQKAGVPVPKNWDEFVAAAPGSWRRPASGPARHRRPALAASGAFDVLIARAGRQGRCSSRSTATRSRSPPGRRSPRCSRLPTTPARWRKKPNVQDWNQATNLVITGKAGGQIMGDWAQGEFQVAGKVAGKDYTCLPGLGLQRAHLDRRRRLLLPDAQGCREGQGPGGARRHVARSKTQVAFNLKKGSLPVRGDVDLDGGQRLHEEGPRDPRQGQRHPVDRPAISRRTPRSRWKTCSPSSSPTDMTSRMRRSASPTSSPTAD